MRYKHPDGEKSQEVEAPLKGKALGQKVSDDFGSPPAWRRSGCCCVTRNTRGSPLIRRYWKRPRARRGTRDDYREEFVNLVRMALTLEQAKK